MAIFGDYTFVNFYGSYLNFLGFLHIYGMSKDGTTNTMDEETVISSTGSLAFIAFSYFTTTITILLSSPLYFPNIPLKPLRSNF